MRKSIKAGLVALVSSSDLHQIVAHLAHLDDHGAFVQLYRCSAGWQLADGLAECEKVMTPILVGIGHAIKTGRWPVLGQSDAEPFSYPLFLMNNGPTSWYLFDGKREKYLGSDVPEEYRNLESFSVWSPELLEERLETGINLLAYDRIRAWPRR